MASSGQVAYIFDEGPGSVVNVHRWVAEGDIRKLLAGTHRIAVLFGHWVGTQTAGNPPGHCDAALPCAVGLDGPVALVMTGPPYRQPAPAGGAEVISPATISRAVDPPAIQRFMVVSPPNVAGAVSWSRKFHHPGRRSQQPMTLPLRYLVFAAFEVVA